MWHTPSHRSPSPALNIPSSRTNGTIPALRAKRKHNFELIIEIPAKKSKSLHRSTSNPPSNSSAASSSRTASNTSAVAASHAPMKKAQNRLSKGAIIRKVLGTPFKVDLDPKIRNITVTRDFMHTHFGVNPTRSFSQISEAQFEKHGYDHFVCVHGVRTTK